LRFSGKRGSARPSSHRPGILIPGGLAESAD
jgi:hypothetical protein